MAEIPALTREQLDSLGEHIAQLSLRIDLAKHAFLTALRQFSTHEGWAGSGFPSAAAWLSWRTGISPTTAREYLRVAKALGEFPRIDAAFAAGQLSYAKVRALTRAASPTTEEGLIDIAMHATAAQIETTCAAYRRTRVHPNACEDAPATPIHAPHHDGERDDPHRDAADAGAGRGRVGGHARRARHRARGG